MGQRGLGYLYQPKYRDKKTKELKTASVFWWDPPSGGRRVSTGCRDRREAEAWRLRRLALLRPRTFEDLCQFIENDYKARELRSGDHLQNRLAHLRRGFGDTLAAEIPDDDVVRYTAKRRVEGAAIATVNLELGHLRRMFKLAHRVIPQECVPTIRLLKGARVRRDVLSDVDLDRILAELPSHYVAPIEALAETGWRLNEILSLEWSQIDWEGQTIRLDAEKTKTGQTRFLGFGHPRLRAILERQAGVRQGLQAEGVICSWVFPARSGGFARGRFGGRISRSAIQGAWRRARKAAGIIAAEGPFIHGLRRKMAKELIDAGVPLLDAMLVTGHRSIETFRNYACRDRDAQERALVARDAAKKAQAARQAGPVVVPFSRES